MITPRPAEKPAPDTLTEELSARQELMRVLGGLPAACRAVFLLRRHQGMTYEEVGGKLGISVHAVHRYMHKALALLRAAKW